MKDWIFDNWSYKLAALVITLILWATVLLRRDFEETFRVQIQWNLPSTFVFSEPPIDMVEFRVIGHRQGLHLLKEKLKLSPLRVDLKSITPGTYLRNFSSFDFPLPEGVRLLHAVPVSVPLHIQVSDKRGVLKNEH